MDLKKIFVVLLLVMSASANAATAVLVREVQTGGLTKQCVYDRFGNTYIITIGQFKVCPRTIQVS